MPKVFPVADGDIPAQFPSALRVSSLAVDQTMNPPVLVVSGEWLHADSHGRGDDERTFALALSPPAAAQLSQLLEKAVRDYLGSGRENETDPGRGRY